MAETVANGRLAKPAVNAGPDAVTLGIGRSASQAQESDNRSPIVVVGTNGGAGLPAQNAPVHGRGAGSAGVDSSSSAPALASASNRADSPGMDSVETGCRPQAAIAEPGAITTASSARAKISRGPPRWIPTCGRIGSGAPRNIRVRGVRIAIGETISAN